METSLFDRKSFVVELPGKVKFEVVLSHNTDKNEKTNYEMSITVLEHAGSQVRFWREYNHNPKRAGRIMSASRNAGGKEIFKQVILFDEVKGAPRVIKTASGLKFFILDKTGNFYTGNITVVVDVDSPKFIPEVTKTGRASIKDGKIYFGKKLEETYEGQCYDWRNPYFELNTQGLPMWNPSFDIEVKPDLSVLKNDDEVLIQRVVWARNMAWGHLKDGSYIRIHLFSEDINFVAGGIYRFDTKTKPADKRSEIQWQLSDLELVKLPA